MKLEAFFGIDPKFERAIVSLEQRVVTVTTSWAVMSPAAGRGDLHQHLTVLHLALPNLEEQRQRDADTISVSNLIGLFPTLHGWAPLFRDKLLAATMPLSLELYGFFVAPVGNYESTNRENWVVVSFELFFGILS